MASRSQVQDFSAHDYNKYLFIEREFDIIVTFELVTVISQGFPFIGKATLRYLYIPN